MRRRLWGAHRGAENSRNGYRVRHWDTRVGTIELAMPKLRRGVYSPEFLLQPRRRAEQALVAVVCARPMWRACRRGGWTTWCRAMGIDGISKSEVSRMAARAGRKVVTEFRERPLDAGPYRYLWIDALVRHEALLVPAVMKGHGRRLVAASRSKLRAA